MKNIMRTSPVVFLYCSLLSLCVAANSITVTPAASSLIASTSGTMTFRVDISYEGTLSACSFSLRTPGSGWTFGQIASATFNLTNTQTGTEPVPPVIVSPQSNDVPVAAEGFGFAFVDIPQSPSSFNFTLKYAAGLTGTQQFTVAPIMVQSTGQSVTLNPTTFSIDVPSTEGFFEADMNDDKRLTISDWVRIGRIVAGLDSIDAGIPFAKADCAPRSTLGDGRTTIIDWVQAGRYAAGLDLALGVGGPTAPVTN